MTRTMILAIVGTLGHLVSKLSSRLFPTQVPNSRCTTQRPSTDPPQGEVLQHPSQSYDSFPDVVALPGLLSAVRLPRLSWVNGFMLLGCRKPGISTFNTANAVVLFRPFKKIVGLDGWEHFHAKK